MPITVFRLPYMTKTTYDPTKDFTYIVGLTGYTFGVVVNSQVALEDLPGARRLRQGQPRKGQVRLARHRHQPAHRHGADRQADRREVDATCPSRAAPRLNAALLGGHIDTHAEFDQLGGVGEFRRLPPAGHMGRRAHQELAQCADAHGARDQAGRQFALWPGRPQGHGPQDRAGAARRLRQGGEGADLHSRRSGSSTRSSPTSIPPTTRSTPLSRSRRPRS